MKKHLLATIGLGLLVCAARADDAKPGDKAAAPAATTNAAPAHEFKDEREKVSYALGMNTASGWKRNEIDLDLESYGKGIKDAMGSGATLMTESEAREALNKFSQEFQAKREEKRKSQAEKNKKDGETFLAENKKKDGVITLPSGLQYKIITDGKGDSPSATDSVTVNYRGTLIDGTEFDSSAKHGQAATFRVNGVIPGWTEALQLMKPGSKWQLYIPSDLAYKDRASGPIITPGSTLIFDVELVSVSAGAPPPPPQPLTSDIIKVPSAEELKKGAKIETIKPEDIEKEKAKEAAAAAAAAASTNK